MACAQTLAGLVNDCQQSIGGVKNIYVAPYVESAATLDAKSEEIASFAEDVTWKKYYVRKNTSGFTSTLNVNDDGGSYVSTELSLVFNRMETKKRIEMTALTLSDLMVVVEDANGVRWFMGFNEPATVSAGTGESGTSKSDSNRYTLSITSEDATYPYSLASDCVLKGI